MCSTLFLEGVALVNFSIGHDSDLIQKQLLQGGPLAVISRGLTSLTGVIWPQLPIYFRPFIGALLGMQHDFHARAVSDPWRMAKKWNLTWKKTWKAVRETAISKNTPTDPWNIPHTRSYLFMIRESFFFGLLGDFWDILGMFQGLLEFS